jgi:hypothetical protein
MTDDLDTTQELDGPAATAPEASEEVASSPHRSSLWIGIALGVSVALALGGILWWRAQQSPQASIGRVAKAAMEGNVGAVEAAIDTTAIVSNAVDDIYNDRHFRQSVVASYTAKHPTASADDIKARLEKSVGTELREHVTNGSLPKRIPIPGDSIKGLVAQAYAQHSVKSITVKGNYAYAVVAVPYHGKTYEVVVRLRRSGRDWVVDRIMNLAEVLKAAGY